MSVWVEALEGFGWLMLWACICGLGIGIAMLSINISAYFAFLFIPFVYLINVISIWILNRRPML